ILLESTQPQRAQIGEGLLQVRLGKGLIAPALPGETALGPVGLLEVGVENTTVEWGLLQLRGMRSQKRAARFIPAKLDQLLRVLSSCQSGAQSQRPSQHARQLTEVRSLDSHGWVLSRAAGEGKFK